METPGTYNITLRRGNTYRQLFEFQNSDESAMDLTGYTLKAQIRATKEQDGTLIETFTVSIPDPTDGKVYLSLTLSKMNALDASTRYWDMLITNPAGTSSETYVEGIVYIKPSVTVKT